MAIPFYYSMKILPEVRKFHRDNDLMKSTIRNIIKLKWQKQATEKGENIGSSLVVFVYQTAFIYMILHASM